MQSQDEIKPLIHHFEDGGHSFVLDIHTNRLFSLSSDESKVIKAWLNNSSLHELSEKYPDEVKQITAMQDEGLFSNRPPEGPAFGLDWERIFDQIKHERSRTVFELTQQCNLRCKYCTFGGGFTDHRTHSQTVMSEETLKKAIDQAFLHGDRLEEISIGFYGGEPLLAWKRFVTGVEYARDQARRLQQRVRFSLTTNATLIDGRKARFLRDAGFSVLVSIDGPRFLHDQYRVYPTGKGSYTKAMQGLKTLLDTYPLDMQGKIGLSMVIPSSDWASYSETLWQKEPWLPETLRAQATVVNAPDGLPNPIPPAKLDEISFHDRWLQELETEVGRQSPLTGAVFNHTMAKFHQRPIFQGRRESFFPNGCCIPAVRKVYVTVAGEYQICERVHGVPAIGTVHNGIDYSSIRRVVDEYADASLQDCKACFAASVCSLCFLHAYESGRFSIEKKRSACSRARRSVEMNLKAYGLASQVYPEKLDEWGSVEIK